MRFSASLTTAFGGPNIHSPTAGTHTSASRQRAASPRASMAARKGLPATRPIWT